MCQSSCIKVIPEGASLVQNVESGRIGRIVKVDPESGMLEVRVGNEWIAAITGHAVFDVDPEWWCPLDVEFIGSEATA